LGIYSYLFFTEGKKLFTVPIFLFSAIAISLLYIEKPNSDIAFLFACLFVLLLFLSPLQYDSMRRFLSQRILIFLGFISYPLYLLHQNMVSGLAIHFAKLYPGLPPVFYPLPFILAVFALAFAVAKLEPHVKFAIKKRLPNQFLGRRLK
jgi:peptidoglycan/LPS O-acetylase OafA/YrhL